jgi:uncharacterized membrane protein
MEDWEGKLVIVLLAMGVAAAFLLKSKEFDKLCDKFILSADSEYEDE